MRPEIRQQGERNAAQFFGPSLEAGRGVGTELQNFAVQLLEFFVVRTEPVDLVRSAAGKCERHERDHDRPAAEARERDLLIGVRGQCEIGCCGSSLNFHAGSPGRVRRQSRHIRIPDCGTSGSYVCSPGYPRRGRVAGTPGRGRAGSAGGALQQSGRANMAAPKTVPVLL